MKIIKKDKLIDVLFLISFPLFLLCELIFKNESWLNIVVNTLIWTCCSVGLIWLIIIVVSRVYKKIKSQELLFKWKVGIGLPLLIFFIVFYLVISLHIEKNNSAAILTVDSNRNKSNDSSESIIEPKTPSQMFYVFVNEAVGEKLGYSDVVKERDRIFHEVITPLLAKKGANNADMINAQGRWNQHTNTMMQQYGFLQKGDNTLYE